MVPKLRGDVSEAFWSVNVARVLCVSDAGSAGAVIVTGSGGVWGIMARAEVQA